MVELTHCAPQAQGRGKALQDYCGRQGATAGQSRVSELPLGFYEAHSSLYTQRLLSCASGEERGACGVAESSSPPSYASPGASGLPLCTSFRKHSEQISCCTALVRLQTTTRLTRALFCLP